MWLQDLLNKYKKSPPYNEKFLSSLAEKDYPKYLKKIFEHNLGYKLNLRNPKTFNEKIQWLKLYDSTPLKTKLTDKVLVREWIQEKIGSEYLKPVFQVCKSFDDIDFENLPHSFIIKANHGCKWHYKIKNKDEFLKTPIVYDFVKRNFFCWMKQAYGWEGLELQYKDINPQILIEPILIDENKNYPIETEAYCFNGKPMIFQEIQYSDPPVCCVYDEQLEVSILKIKKKYHKVSKSADKHLTEIKFLSEKLSEEFKFVRVDWLIFNNKLYFNEMTFTPFSGFNDFPNKNADNILGSLINLK